MKPAQGRPAVATSPPLPPGQWSAGTRRPGDADPSVNPVSSLTNSTEAAERVRFWDQAADTYQGVHEALTLEQLRAWLWAHTAQPNGDPWDAAAPDELDRAARDLAATLAGGTP